MSDDEDNPKAFAKPAGSPAAEQPRTKYVKLPTDRAGQRRAIKEAFLNAWRELNAALGAVSHDERQQAASIDGTAMMAAPMPTAWLHRVADELRLSDLSRDLLLSRLTIATEVSPGDKMDTCQIR
jgi:hypothetical protein